MVMGVGTKGVALGVAFFEPEIAIFLSIKIRGLFFYIF